MLKYWRGVGKMIAHFCYVRGEMANKVVSIVKKGVVPLIENEGYFVLDVEFAKKENGMNLTFVIDHDDGISFNDCKKVHKLIDGVLDELNPTDDQPYSLNVSSPGLDRPILCERDFVRNFGKEVDVKLFAAQNGKKIHTGCLEEFSKNHVTICCGGEKISFDLKAVAIIKPVIKM